MKKNIAVIGCGNLGMSIVKGLLNRKEQVNIYVTDRDLKPIQHLEQEGVKIGTNNNDAILDADIILVAVKPFRMIPVIEDMKTNLKAGQVIISLAPGVSLEELETAVPTGVIVYRGMPNVAASVNESVSCICSNNKDEDIQNSVNELFELFGTSEIINEELMDASTVIGACGTAFALRFIRAMVQAGVQIGFDSKTATAIATQTVKGATQILHDSGEHPESAVDRVTTPKGITITGLNEMENHGFSAALIQGMLASYRKFEG